jgi:hypothetical protein|tara:strand:- start:13 stop:294 length:282 start_codon:yes stop_codon:yes gene_type:complete
MRKTYPLIRRKPKFENFGDISNVEVSTVSFNNSNSETYTFTSTYTSLPICNITPELDNVNVFISSLSLTSVTIEASDNFTGNVHIHIYPEEVS